MAQKTKYTIVALHNVSGWFYFTGRDEYSKGLHIAHPNLEDAFEAMNEALTLLLEHNHGITDEVPVVVLQDKTAKRGFKA